MPAGLLQCLQQLGLLEMFDYLSTVSGGGYIGGFWTPKPEPGKRDKKRLGRIYVTYTKLNKTTHRYYAGRTSMVVDLTQSLEFQAITAVLLRDKNHHTDENAELKNGAFADGGSG